MLDTISLLAGCSLALLLPPLYRTGHRLLPYFTRSKLPSRFPDNRYVIVTGCTDGIGKAFFNQFQNKNLKVIAISRNKDKLSQLQAEYPGTITLQMDFQKLSLVEIELDKTVDTVLGRLEIEGKIVGAVNCIGNAHFSKYRYLSPKEITDLNSVNIAPLHCLLGMINTLRQRKRLEEYPFLINISSEVGQRPFKYSAVYSATKAYLSCLLYSYTKEETYLTVLDVRPWFVRTKMVGYKEGWDCVRPHEIAEGVLRVIGKRQVCAGCWKHQLFGEFGWWVRRQIQSALQQQMEKVERVQALLRERRKNRK